MSVLECRGPDSQDEIHQDAYSAGQCRLEVIGLGDPGRQPYSQDPAEDVLVFSGEIYNYRELAATYGVPAESDTQVLYHLLHHGLEGRLSELRGMFAFVYWRRHPQTVIAARDYFGIKPLYVSESPDGSLTFASVPAALVALDNRRSANPVAVAGFLAAGFIPTGTSMHSGIEKCPEGIVTTWRKMGRAWESSGAALTLDSWPIVPPEEAVADSVLAHLVSDVPVGVLLSGGVDSTLLAAIAAPQVDRLRSYSLTNPQTPDIDESEYARWNASVLGTVHTEVPFDPATAMDTILALVQSSGEPFGDPAFVPLAVLCERVGLDLKVVLAGEGADELFGGYRRYDVERLRHRTALKALLRVVGTTLGGTSSYRAGAPSQLTRTWAAWAASDDLQSHGYLLGAEWSACADALPRATMEALACSHATWSGLERGTRALGLPAYRAFDLTQWLPNVFLEKSDRASMLHGVEVRVPYLDPVVARASTTDGPRDSSKRPLREALHRLAPDVRLPPRKLGLGVDTPGLLVASGLSSYAEYELEDSRSLLRTLEFGDLGPLAKRARLNPTLAFRLGTLGLWEQEFLG